jgi:hypothetical protein
MSVEELIGTIETDAFEALSEPLWLILVSPLGSGFIACEAERFNGTFYKVTVDIAGAAKVVSYACDNINSIVAKHPTKEAAEAAIKRAQNVELTVRPFWQAAIEHELTLRNLMLDLSHAAAQPQQ